VSADVSADEGSELVALTRMLLARGESFCECGMFATRWLKLTPEALKLLGDPYCYVNACDECADDGARIDRELKMGGYADEEMRARAVALGVVSTELPNAKLVRRQRALLDRR
jgi:hypothetical protein